MPAQWQAMFAILMPSWLGIVCCFRIDLTAKDVLNFTARHSGQIADAEEPPHARVGDVMLSSLLAITTEQTGGEAVGMGTVPLYRQSAQVITSSKVRFWNRDEVQMAPGWFEGFTTNSDLKVPGGKEAEWLWANMLPCQGAKEPCQWRQRSLVNWHDVIADSEGNIMLQGTRKVIGVQEAFDSCCSQMQYTRPHFLDNLLGQSAQIKVSFPLEPNTPYSDFTVWEGDMQPKAWDGALWDVACPPESEGVSRAMRIAAEEVNMIAPKMKVVTIPMKSTGGTEEFPVGMLALRYQCLGLQRAELLNPSSSLTMIIKVHDIALYLKKRSTD